MIPKNRFKGFLCFFPAVYFILEDGEACGPRAHPRDLSLKAPFMVFDTCTPGII